MTLKQYIPLGNVISKASVERCGKRQLPILSITMKDGLVMQDEKFKKRIASADTTDYKVYVFVRSDSRFLQALDR